MGPAGPRFQAGRSEMVNRLQLLGRVCAGPFALSETPSLRFGAFPKFIGSCRQSDSLCRLKLNDHDFLRNIDLCHAFVVLPCLCARMKTKFVGEGWCHGKSTFAAKSASDPICALA